jgi:hypothetical protein
MSVVNLGSTALTVPVEFRLYYWNATSEKTFIGSEIKSVSVPAKGKATVSYELKESGRSLYQVLAHAASNGVDSFISTSIERSAAEALVSSIGLTPFPSQGKEIQAYACLHNSFSDDEEQRRVYLTISDTAGNLIDQSNFPSPANTSEFMVSKGFMSGNVQGISLSADVFSAAGALMSHFKQSFACSDFGGNCSGQNQVSSGGPGSSGNWKEDLIFAVTLFAAGSGGIIAVLARPRRKVPPPPMITNK